MNYEVLILLCMILPCLGISLVLSVIIHELGHLVGGLLSGYGFTKLSMFGMEIYNDYGRLRFKKTAYLPIGQCTMYPVTFKQTPKLLIAGGIVANIAAGGIVLFLGIFAGNIYLMIFCICFGGINTAVGLLNAIPDSPTNDGSTLRDIRRGTEQIELYNRIMLVYRELERGTEYEDLPESLLDGPVILDSALSAELALYRYYRIRDMYAKNPSEKNLIRIERHKLLQFERATGLSEVLYDI